MSKPFLDRRWPWVVATLVVVLGFLSTVLEVRFGTDADPRPIGSADDIERLAEREDLNVLFVLIDTLRADHLGSYGYERDTSPELDRLAAGGVRFDRHMSQSSWTKSSMASLWTGLYPARTGITRYDHIVPDQAEMPAETFQQAGFRTVGLYRNGWVAPTFGFGQGFDVYIRPASGAVRRSIRVENQTLVSKSTDEDAVAAALEFLRVHGHERWFLYLHLMDVHEYLYDEESALFGGDYGDIYDNSIRWTDSVIRVLIAHLAQQGYAENTVVVITSDHGEAFRERGLEGHARRVYRETTEVPFILAFPFRLERGIVFEGRTRNVDVWPTVLDLLGLPFPVDQDGRSLRSDLLATARGEALSEPDPVAVAHLDQNWGKRKQGPVESVAVVDEALRYVRGNDRGRPIEQLFDATNDPGELDDRAEDLPDELIRLRETANAYLQTTPPWGDAPTREIEELELNQLRALGYAIP
ncbi:MAG: sulfatase [Myxococcota bacterium]|nr:sulfatase [Myxococcota bacterium]